MGLPFSPPRGQKAKRGSAWDNGPPSPAKGAAMSKEDKIALLEKQLQALKEDGPPHAQEEQEVLGQEAKAKREALRSSLALLESQYSPEHEMVQAIRVQLQELDKQRPASVRLLQLQRRSDQLQKKLQGKLKDIQGCEQQMQELKDKKVQYEEQVEQIKREVEDLEKERREVVIPKQEEAGRTPLAQALGVPEDVLAKEEFAPAKALLEKLEPMLQKLLEAAKQSAQAAQPKEAAAGEAPAASDAGSRSGGSGGSAEEAADVDMGEQADCKDIHELFRKYEESILAGQAAPAGGPDDAARADLRRQLYKEVAAATASKRQKTSG